MIIVDVEQRSPQWLALRRGAITASKADRLLTPAKVRELALELATERLVRELPEQPITAAMQRGIDLEPTARLRHAFEAGVHVDEIGFCWHAELEGWVGCSPDGLVGNDGLVEIKCPSSKRHLETLISREPGAEYRAQMQMQMWICERVWCDFVSYDDRFDSGDYVAIRVQRDDELITKLATGATACIEQMQRHLDAYRNINRREAA
jgi:putative phage-type endonuclease